MEAYLIFDTKNSIEKKKKQTKSIDIKVFILDPCHCATENKISDRNIYFVNCKLDLIFYFHA
jgi:hypothetical protein